ncbi:MAG TPA: tRNA (adenosine(37)-N6)-threonylcarbamoyltransferase complex ATPase subunit type 1 TsaE [Gemmatimonas sp.]|nr:tRNA (adenosine(37)-N6)-threonylcarbamoyltransferase complex ATPase subunit type 1 TsaE [Gemmatimonas sp.]
MDARAAGGSDETSLGHLLGRGAPRSPDRDSLDAWGRLLGAALPRPAVVALEGELGAGKTALARAICAGAGVRDLSAVTSPTFSLVQQYDAPRGPVVHVDLYRLRSVAELDALGWDEIVDNASLLLVEWPQRAAASLPRDTICIMLSHDSSNPDRRMLRVVAAPR